MGDDIFSLSNLPFNPDPIVGRVVRSCLEPFEPGMVTLWIVTSFIDPVIVVQCSTLPDDTFRMDGRELYGVGNDLREMAEFIGFKAGQYFSSLREPVPDTIGLGEN